MSRKSLRVKAERFFIVGAQRSGTTYLYRCCAEHPQIEMAQPIQPEPKFFLLDALYERGIEYYQATFFTGKSGALALGEKSTSYMESEKAAARIAAHYPSARIIFLLRDPIERAISNYWFSVKNGLETLPMAEAFLHEEQRWQDYDRGKVSASPFAYLRRGRYIDQIEMYERFFAASQLHIMIHEQLLRSDTTLTSFYAFLGVDADFTPTMRDQKVNANEERQAVALDPALEDFLLSYFAEPNARLGRRLGVSLDEWKNRNRVTGGRAMSGKNTRSSL